MSVNNNPGNPGASGSNAANPVVLTQTSSPAVPAIKVRSKKLSNLGSSVQTNNVPHNNVPNHVPQPTTIANQGVSASTTAPTSSPTKADQIIQKFLDKVPQDPNNPDRYMLSKDKRIENAIRQQLADPDEPKKTYGTLFADKTEFENFFILLNFNLEKMRDKREGASNTLGKAYTGFDKATIENKIKSLCEDFANNNVNTDDLDKAIKEFKPPQAVVIDPKTQTSTSAAVPYANLKLNEKALVNKIIEELVDELKIKPNTDPNFLESGNNYLENALDAQIGNPDRYLPRYGGLFKDKDQLVVVLKDIKRYLDLNARQKQDDCNAKNQAYQGVPFSEIKKEIEVRVFELANNKLHMNFAAYAVSATGGPAHKLTYAFVQAQTQAYLLSLAAAKEKEKCVDVEVGTHEHYLSLLSDETLSSMIQEIKRDLDDLTREMREMTAEGFKIMLHNFYEQHKELIFERKIKEGLERSDENSIITLP